MKNTIISVLFIIVIILAANKVYAQNLSTNITPCHPSTDEILSIIKVSYDLSPNPKGVLFTGRKTPSVLITGEMPTGAQGLYLSKGPISAILAIEMLGGIKKTGSGLIYIVRHSADKETKTLLELDFKAVKQGNTKDLLLEDGDIVFVPRICSGGKLPLPTNKRKPIYNLQKPIDSRVAR